MFDQDTFQTSKLHALSQRLPCTRGCKIHWIVVVSGEPVPQHCTDKVVNPFVLVSKLVHSCWFIQKQFGKVITVSRRVCSDA